MATLKSPFFGEKENVSSLVQKILEADFPPLPQDCYTEQLELLISACLDPDTTKRPNANQVSQVAEHMHRQWTQYFYYDRCAYSNGAGPSNSTRK